MKKHHHIADLATVREAFLAAYPTTYERQHGERPPTLRRQDSGKGLCSASLSRDNSQESKDGGGGGREQVWGQHHAGDIVACGGQPSLLCWELWSNVCEDIFL